MRKPIPFSLTQLEYALAVQRQGHFAKAAQFCHVTQPTLSMQIQKLEEDLGAPLFDRSKKPILVTEFGKKALMQFQNILFEAHKVENIIEQSQESTLKGTLTLGVIPTIAPNLIPRLLSVLEKEFPQLHLKISEIQTEVIIDKLQNDELDVGLLATPLHSAHINEYPLYYEPFRFLCHEKHPFKNLKKIKQAQLTTEDLWLLPEGHCLRNQILDICTLKKKSTPRAFSFESGSIETLKNLVNAYGGYTLIPALSSEDIGAHSQLLDFERPIPAREIGLVYRRKQYKLNLIEALGEGILKSLPENIRKLRTKDLEILPVEASRKK